MARATRCTGPRPLSLSLWSAETKYSLSDTRIKRKQSECNKAQTSDLGTVCLAHGRPPPLPKTNDSSSTSVKPRTATPQPQRRRTTGHPFPSRNMIKQLLLAHSFNVSRELCFTRVPRRRHLHPPSWAHASGPESRALSCSHFAGLQKWLDMRVLSYGMALMTEQDQIGTSNRHGPHHTWHQLSSNSTWDSATCGDVPMYKEWAEKISGGSECSSPQLTARSLTLARACFGRFFGSVPAFLRMVGGLGAPPQVRVRGGRVREGRVAAATGRPIHLKKSRRARCRRARSLVWGWCAGQTVGGEAMHGTWQMYLRPIP